MSALDEFNAALRESVVGQRQGSFGASVRDKALLEFLQHYTIENDEAGKPRIVENIATKTELNSPVVFSAFEVLIHFMDFAFGELGAPSVYEDSRGNRVSVRSPHFADLYDGMKGLRAKLKRTEQQLEAYNLLKLFDRLFKINMVSKDRKSRGEAERVLTAMTAFERTEESKEKDVRKL